MFVAWLGFVLVLLCVSADPKAHTDVLPFDMDSLIGILEDAESHLNGTTDVPVPGLFQELGCCKSKFWKTSFGPGTSTPSDLSYLSEKQKIFLKDMQRHNVDHSLVEHGVLLVPDGTTVALSPLFAGIAAGLKKKQEVALPGTPLLNDTLQVTGEQQPLTLDPLFALTIAEELSIAFLLFHSNQSQVALGPNGCWDNISAPHTFTLMGPPSALPDAFINGAMDGLILGTYLMETAELLPTISSLLRAYYARGALEGKSQARSNFRRKNFATLVTKEMLTEQVAYSLRLLWQMNKTSSLFKGIGGHDLISLANQAVEEFMMLYVECPAIIPRCMWLARPYKGTPTPLKLPLEFVYIHHTHSPGKQCRTFSECTANMRSMQRFHQDVRGWDDIGYNFVAGSDGYLYQGRGWHWVGAHTKGFNSKGYGVSFIGDYMETLPASFAMNLVKENFMKCAVKGNRLKATYTIHGHRQMGHTLCPGDRLFEEIKTWKGFKLRCFMEKGVRHCV